MIILVVIMHLAVTYSAMGGWYYYDTGTLDAFSTVLFGFYTSFTQGYFMGILFLIAGYFVPASYAAKGFGKFVRGRFYRLGIPSLIYVFIIQPLILYFELNLGQAGFFRYYGAYITDWSFVGGTGPLWFTVVLFVFSFIYALVRLIFKKTDFNNIKCKTNTKNIFIFIGIIAAATYAVRIFAPIGYSAANMQFCYFPQYIAMFIIGTVLKNTDAFENSDFRKGKIWLICGLSAGFVLWAVIMLVSGAIEGARPYFGGLNWQSALYCVWESFVAVSMSYGLITLYREKLNRSNKFANALSADSFSVYMFHAPLIIGVSILLSKLNIVPIAKFIIAAAVSLPLIFALSHFILRRIPLLKKIL